MDSTMDSHGHSGQGFTAGSGHIPAPDSLVEKVLQVRRLLGEIHHALGLPPLGPGGGPLVPPGTIPGMVVPKDEIERIRDSIYGGIATGIVGAALELPPGIQIAGVETTQAIQFFNLNKQGSGAGADNSVPLVAGKELVLRVYVERRTGPTGYVPATVTARVRIGARELLPLNGPIPVLAPGLLQRSNLNHTLNFRVPAALCHGTRTITVRAFDAAEVPPWAGTGVGLEVGVIRVSSTSETLAVRFREVPPIRVSAVLINFTGNDLNLPAPPATALLDTLARFLPMLPTHGFDFGPCEQFQYGESLAVRAGWDTLLDRIADKRSLSSVLTFFVGLLPEKTMEQVKDATLRGIGRPGVAVGSRNDTRALSHEFGHATRIEHVDAGGAPAPFDAAYPTYGSFPFGSIGEFGLDTARMTLFNPATAQDRMTYSDSANVNFPTGTWISPYHYQKMMNSLIASEGTSWVTIVVTLVMNFRVHRDGRVELRPSYLATGIPPRDAGRPTRPVMLDLVGRDGTVLGSHRCHVHNPYQDPDGAYLDFHEVLPWSTEVARVVVVREREVVGTIDVGERPPRIRLGELHRVTRDGDLARLDWAVDDIDGPHHAAVRYSNDDGRSWYALATGLTEGRYLVDLDALPGGERCRLEVIVSSGLQSAAAQTEPFDVRRKPRQAHVVSPREGDVFRAGVPVAFMGGGYSPDGGVCAPDETLWRSSLDGTLGTGMQLVRGDLQPGTHRITLTLPDGAGGEATAGVWIRVVEEGGSPAECPPEEGHRHLG